MSVPVVEGSSQQDRGLTSHCPLLPLIEVPSLLEPIEKGGHKRGYPHSHLILGQLNLEKTKITLTTMNYKPQLRLDGGDISGGERYPKALRSIEISIILLGGFISVCWFCCCELHLPIYFLSLKLQKLEYLIECLGCCLLPPIYLWSWLIIISYTR